MISTQKHSKIFPFQLASLNGYPLEESLPQAVGIVVAVAALTALATLFGLSAGVIEGLPYRLPLYLAISFLFIGLSLIWGRRLPRLSLALLAPALVTLLVTIAFFWIGTQPDIFAQLLYPTQTLHLGALFATLSLTIGCLEFTRAPTNLSRTVLWASFAFAIGTIGLFKVLLGLDDYVGWVRFFNIGWLSGVGITLISATLIASSWLSGSSRSASRIPDWGPFVVFALGTTMSIVVYQSIGQASVNRLQGETRDVSRFFSDFFSATMQSNANTLTRMGSRNYAESGSDRSSWNADTDSFFDEIPGLVSLGTANLDGEVIRANTSTKAPVELNIEEQIQKQLISIGKSARTDAFTVPTVFPLRGNPDYLLQAIPIFYKGQISSLAFGVYRAADTQKPISTRPYLEPYRFDVIPNPESAFTFESGKAPYPISRAYESWTDLSLGHFGWRIRALPSDELVKSRQNILAWGIFSAGFILSTLLGLLIYSIRRVEIEHFHAVSNAARLSAVVSGSTRVAIIVTDTSGIITLFNPGAERMLGYRQDEMVNKASPMIFHKREEILSFLGTGDIMDNVSAFVHLTGSARTGNFEERQWTYVRKDGTELPVNLIVTPILMNGEREGFLEIAVDITEPERRLRNYANKLEESNRELEEFNYVASHDLKEPVRNLVSYSSLLEEDVGEGLSEDAKDDLKYIKSSARRMQTLIDDLLQLSRAGRSAMKIKTIQSSELFSFVLRSLETQIEESGAEVEIAKNLPAIEGDKTTLSLLFLNLVSNAIKFAQDGVKPHVSISFVQTEHAHHFTVSDNGIGIETKYLKSIFSPFKRLHGMEKYPGTGIGLAICQKVVTRHGGKIWVESQPGEGSRFHVVLPMKGAKS